MCVVGRVFKPSRLKVLALNMALNEYFRPVEWYLVFNSKPKSFIHENYHGKAKELFNLNTALIERVRIRGLYNHVRRRLQKKGLLKRVKELKGKERRKVDQQLHIIANQIVAYVKRFPKPVIVMGDLNWIISRDRRRLTGDSIAYHLENFKQSLNIRRL
jgi:hypothetical protein